MNIFGTPEPDAVYTDRVGSYGIYFIGDSVLLEKTYLGYFLPGGGCDEGETQLDALKRELMEEAGYEVSEVGKYFDAIQYVRVPHLKNPLKKVCRFYHVLKAKKVSEPVHPDTDPDGTVHETELASIEFALENMKLEAEVWAVQEALADRSLGVTTYPGRSAS